jgi:hypothetical protein
VIPSACEFYMIGDSRIPHYIQLHIDFQQKKGYLSLVDLHVTKRGPFLKATDP